ncbi:unnamed protein product [Schistosoma mattheei]|uniref:Uncharacterized protein n=1 Tax=Schistosoma mattheei TaxID=31246 RepID=A0A3P8C4B4_9TREM|nr:unnamed protein product [Schistosoma mattheei]
MNVTKVNVSVFSKRPYILVQEFRERTPSVFLKSIMVQQETTPNRRVLKISVLHICAPVDDLSLSADD